MEEIIQIRHLEKSYGIQKALCQVSFSVRKGQTFALLGPNGAGKSTLINLLCTCSSYDKGQVLIDGLRLGIDNPKIRSRIGVVFQNGILDDLLTIEENLFFRGRFYGLQGKELQNRILQTARITGISDLLSKQYQSLSGGQRRRCDIARALLPAPKILFLDEPSTGLDPEIRTELWSTLQKIKKEQHMTIFLTTHYMEEAAYADYIAILNKGSIIATGTPSDIKNRFSKNQLILFTNQIHFLRSILNRHHISYQISADTIVIPISNTLDALPLLKLCQGAFSDFEVLRGTLNEAYLSIIGGTP